MNRTKNCERCSKLEIWKDSPPGNPYCKDCLKRILLSRIKATIRKHDWSNFSLVGADEFAVAILGQVRKDIPLPEKKVASGSSDSLLIHWLNELANDQNITEPRKYLCEALTPSECGALAKILKTSIEFPENEWTTELDKLEKRSPEIRHSLVASFRHRLSAGVSRARFRPPDALLSIKGLRKHSD